MAAQPPNHSPTEHSSSVSSLSSSQIAYSEPPLPLLNQTENIQLFYAKKEQKMPVVVVMSIGLSYDEFALIYLSVGLSEISQNHFKESIGVTQRKGKSCDGPFKVVVMLH